jgi:hypothetical protein
MQEDGDVDGDGATAKASNGQGKNGIASSALVVSSAHCCIAFGLTMHYSLD